MSNLAKHVPSDNAAEALSRAWSHAQNKCGGVFVDGVALTAAELGEFQIAVGAKANWLDLSQENGRIAYGLCRSLVRSLPRNGLSDLQRLVIGNLEPGSPDQILPTLTSYQSRYRLFDTIRAQLALAADTKPLVIVVRNLDRSDLASLRFLRFVIPFLPRVSVLLIVTGTLGVSDDGMKANIINHIRSLRKLDVPEVGIEQNSSIDRLSAAVDEELERDLHTSGGFLSPNKSDVCRMLAKWADSVGAPEFRARYLRLLTDDTNVSPERGDLADLAVAAAETNSLAEIPRLVLKWLDVSPSSSQIADEASDLAVRLFDAGAGLEELRGLTGKISSRSDVRDVPWARISLLNPPEINEVADGRVTVGRWIGNDPEALTVLRSSGRPDDVARTLFVYDWWTKDDVEHLVAAARDWTSDSAKGRVLSVASETLMYRHGEFARACELLQEQFSLQEHRGAIEEQAKSLVRLTMALLADGQLDLAESTREHARATVDRLGPDYLIYEHSGTKSGGDLYPEISMESNFAWYREGDWLAVAEHWAKAVTMHEHGGSPVHIVEAAMAAQAYARLGMRDSAKIYLDELRVILPHLQSRDWAFNGAVGRASHAIWDLLDDTYSREFFKYTVAMLADGVGDWTNTSLQNTAGRMAALNGDFDTATRYFEEARGRLNSSQVPQLAIVDFDEAVAIRLSGHVLSDRRSDLLRDALRTFDECRMMGWIGRAESEIAMGAE